MIFSYYRSFSIQLILIFILLMYKKIYSTYHQFKSLFLSFKKLYTITLYHNVVFSSNLGCVVTETHSVLSNALNDS